MRIPITCVILGTRRQPLHLRRSGLLLTAPLYCPHATSSTVCARLVDDEQDYYSNTWLWDQGTPSKIWCPSGHLFLCPEYKWELANLQKIASKWTWAWWMLGFGSHCTQLWVGFSIGGTCPWVRSPLMDGAHFLGFWICLARSNYHSSLRLPSSLLHSINPGRWWRIFLLESSSRIENYRECAQKSFEMERGVLVCRWWLKKFGCWWPISHRYALQLSSSSQ